MTIIQPAEPDSTANASLAIALFAAERSFHLFLEMVEIDMVPLQCLYGEAVVRGQAFPRA